MRRRFSRRGRKSLFSLFLLTAAASSVFYWLPLRYTVGAQHLFWARKVMLENAVEWWQGVAGRALTHYRPGFQAATLDPAAGRLVSVTDFYLDTDGVLKAMEGLAPGRWLVLTINAPSLGDGLGKVAESVRQAGWTGDLAPANQGMGAVVLVRPARGAALQVLQAGVTDSLDLRLLLPAGLTGPDGAVLPAAFPILVRDYDYIPQ